MLTPQYTIELSKDERAQLEAWLWAGKTPQRTAKRATIVLLADAGWGNQQIAEEVGTSRNLVQKWRKRFALSSPRGPAPEAQPDPLARLQALEDWERSGRPPVFPPAGAPRRGRHRLPSS
jgi:hypothetical protein